MSSPASDPLTEILRRHVADIDDEMEMLERPERIMQIEQRSVAQITKWIAEQVIKPDDDHSGYCVEVGQVAETIDGEHFTAIEGLPGHCDCGAATRNDLRHEQRQRLSQPPDNEVR